MNSYNSVITSIKIRWKTKMVNIKKIKEKGNYSKRDDNQQTTRINRIPKKIIILHKKKYRTIAN